MQLFSDEAFSKAIIAPVNILVAGFEKLGRNVVNSESSSSQPTALAAGPFCADSTSCGTIALAAARLH